jgi:hypothetical protein
MLLYGMRILIGVYHFLMASLDSICWKYDPPVTRSLQTIRMYDAIDIRVEFPVIPLISSEFQHVVGSPKSRDIYD